ncbi:DUF616 domain-containing protein [Candidatus Saccharibacteria bacterium]|nr:DUF616 domain-containing protein [Candidatus Saccharibacteria bacterium]
MKKICVYTCITGNYDNLHEIEIIEDGVDYLCFTNNKNLKSKTWKIIHIEDNKLDNHHLSRKIKMLGHPIISKDYDISVWMDASVVWQKSVKDFTNNYLKNTTFAAFKHSQRNSILEEAFACLRFRKDTKDNILKTLSFLEQEKFPDNLGLFEMTVFIKKHNDPTVIKTMETWFNAVCKKSKRDQLSFMYAVWKNNLRVTPINLSVWDNQWFYTIKHNTNSDIVDCHIYYGNSNQVIDFSKYFIYKYKKNGSTFSVKTTIPFDTPEIEINITNSPGIDFKNIIFKPKYQHLIILGSVNIKNKSVFYTGCSTIKYYSNFKKGQELFFSINMSILDQKQLQELFEGLSIKNDLLINQNNQLKSDNALLRHVNQDLNNQLNAIKNSKSWKIIQKYQKALKLFHK